VVIPPEYFMGGCLMSEVIARSYEWLDKLADYVSIVFSALFMTIIVVSQY